MRALLVVLWMLPALARAVPEGKVQVCHVPPSNPGNYHTITIPEAALKAHLAHGDLAGPCANFCGVFCGDDSVCTQDTGTFDYVTEKCVCSNLPVDCSSTTPCLQPTGCDPTLGCQYAPNEGAACEADTNVCTGPDTCDGAGSCVAGPSIAGCCLSDAECPTDACQHSECVANACTTPVPTQVALDCVPVNACSTAVCDPVQGCVQAEKVWGGCDICYVGEGCYWMENYTGNYCFVPAEQVYHRSLTFDECRSLDSCGPGGGGTSGGGCYKWAPCSFCQEVPWP